MQFIIPEAAAVPSTVTGTTRTYEKHQRRTGRRHVDRRRTYKRWKINKHREWRKIYRTVLVQYLELKAVNGTVSCAALWRAILNDTGVSIPGVHPAMVLQPTASDFIADFELIVKRVLKAYGHEIDSALDQKKARKLDRRTQECLGRSLESHALFPVQRYFRPKRLTRREGV